MQNIELVLVNEKGQVLHRVDVPIVSLADTSIISVDDEFFVFDYFIKGGAVRYRRTTILNLSVK